jgi:hypothetical protein
MNIYLENRDVLLKILSYTQDPYDWICFMLCCTQTHHLLYSSFLCTKFRIMRIQNMTMPNCILTNNRIKTYTEIRHEECIITDPYIILACSEISESIIYEIYGYALINIVFSDRGIDLNYDKMIDIIAHYYDSNFTFDNDDFHICSNKLFFEINETEYHKLAYEFCYKYRSENLDENLNRINRSMFRNIKNPFHDDKFSVPYILYFTNWVLQKCIFCKNYFNKNGMTNHEVTVLSHTTSACITNYVSNILYD